MTIVHFHLVPNAKINQVVGAHGAAIKIKLRAVGRWKSQRGVTQFPGCTIGNLKARDRAGARSKIAGEIDSYRRFERR
jgi:hypothetical protein